jgi:hypothetical protein
VRDFTHVILILLAREIVLFSRVLTNVETLRFEGKQDLVFPEGTDIKCFVI